MKCSHCGASKAPESWTLQVCASKRRKKRNWLCTACDIALNRLILEFFKDPKTEAKMKAYEEKMNEHE